MDPACSSLYRPNEELLEHYNSLEVTRLKSIEKITTVSMDEFAFKCLCGFHEAGIGFVNHAQSGCIPSMEMVRQRVRRPAGGTQFLPHQGTGSVFLKEFQNCPDYRKTLEIPGYPQGM